MKCGRMSEYLDETHVDTGRTCNLYTAVASINHEINPTHLHEFSFGPIIWSNPLTGAILSKLGKVSCLCCNVSC